MTFKSPRDRQSLRCKLRNGRTTGFTLMEILIVVMILGILAAIVIPQFSNASVETRQNTLHDILHFMRTQVVMYKAQHKEVPAGYPNGNLAAAPDGGTFAEQMTQFTDDLCNTSPAGSPVYRFGPYLSQMPANPLNGKTTVLIVADGAALPDPDGSTGWIYKPQTLEFLPNLTGKDSNGQPYSNY